MSLNVIIKYFKMEVLGTYPKLEVIAEGQKCVFLTSKKLAEIKATALLGENLF